MRGSAPGRSMMVFGIGDLVVHRNFLRSIRAQCRQQNTKGNDSTAPCGRWPLAASQRSPQDLSSVGCSETPPCNKGAQRSRAAGNSADAIIRNEGTAGAILERDHHLAEV